MKKYNLEGRRFGKLIVTKLGDTKKGIHRTWDCICDCGKCVNIIQTHLIQKRSTSCGCSKIKSKKHGFAGVGDIHASRLNDIERKASHKNIEFNLTLDFLWTLFLTQNKKCAISGIDIYFGKTSKQWGTASLDRKDNTKGYTKDNVWWVHKDINKMKNVHKLEYFISLCKKIANYNTEIK